MNYVTHVACAKCGMDNTVRSDDQTKNPITIQNSIHYVRLVFSCQHCKEEYPMSGPIPGTLVT